mmetsp:Transcript_16579/g.51871  ORF Transcript_16579/g.51871 Transcript_16579/m.51871 type:complete len:183 (+) Transcript_16579:77-625(+)
MLVESLQAARCSLQAARCARCTWHVVTCILHDVRFPSSVLPTFLAAPLSYCSVRSLLSIRRLHLPVRPPFFARQPHPSSRTSPATATVHLTPYHTIRRPARHSYSRLFFRLNCLQPCTLLSRPCAHSASRADATLAAVAAAARPAPTSSASPRSLSGRPSTLVDPNISLVSRILAAYCSTSR